jgi:cobalamin biosynthesis protein CbiG
MSSAPWSAASRSLVVGLGWSGQPSAEALARALRAVFERRRLSLEAVRLLATIEHKGREPALLVLASSLGWPLQLYSAEELRAVPGIAHASERVEHHVGTPAVAEAAALRGAAASVLLVPRQVVREASSSVTMAIARVPFATGG